MAGTKLSIYLTADIAAELHKECERLDRGRSYLLIQAWTIAKDELRQYPAGGPSEHPLEVTAPHEFVPEIGYTDDD